MDPITGGQPQQVQPVQPIQPNPAAANGQQSVPIPPVSPQPGAVPVAQPQVGAQQPAPMPQLDDQFLQEVGLGVLPVEERQGMIAQMKKTLETNVGMEIYKNLQEHQLQEFEGFMPLSDPDSGQVITSEETANANARRWLDVNVPGWAQNQQLAPYLTDPARVRDFAAMNWLQRNFPAYRNVVAAELNKLMTEVRNNVPRIIEAVMGPQNNVGQSAPQPQMAAPEQTKPMAQPPVQPPMDQQPPVAPAA
ncbi:MAG: hypothetical protein H6799_01500 [Candidatus Nomurabacteria bacterium]|nr:MAG: hypothetical protein H6799_01500 [Candidatus Nomurabacteria bacterium]HRV75935.1 DUF5663 domain-containing protein [Candidatus Saccharimonadales bacterium]